MIRGTAKETIGCALPTAGPGLYDDAERAPATGDTVPSPHGLLAPLYARVASGLPSPDGSPSWPDGTELSRFADDDPPPPRDRRAGRHGAATGHTSLKSLYREWPTRRDHSLHQGFSTDPSRRILHAGPLGSRSRCRVPSATVGTSGHRRRKSALRDQRTTSTDRGSASPGPGARRCRVLRTPRGRCADHWRTGSGPTWPSRLDQPRQDRKQVAGQRVHRRTDGDDRLMGSPP